MSNAAVKEYPGVGSFRPLKTKVFAASASSYTFAGLKSYGADAYVIKAKILRSAVNAIISVRPNGVNTSVNTRVFYSDDGNVWATLGTGNQGQLYTIYNGFGTQTIIQVDFTATIEAKIGTRRALSADSIGISNDGSPKVTQGRTRGYFDDLTTPISSLLVTDNSGSNMLAGTELSLWGMFNK